jgi:hypothetical protein
MTLLHGGIAWTRRLSALKCGRIPWGALNRSILCAAAIDALDTLFQSFGSAGYLGGGFELPGWALHAGRIHIDRCGSPV